MKLFKQVLSLILVFTFSAFAHDHPASQIEGENIHLFERNHAFAGEILGVAAFGVFEHEPFGSKIEFRRGEKTLNLEFSNKDDGYSGAITETLDENTPSLVTTLKLVSVKKTGSTEGLITLNIDGVDVPVTVKGKKFEQGHFIEPQFEVVLNGKLISFNFSGQSCFGYSSNIALMIFGSYAHLMK